MSEKNKVEFNAPHYEPNLSYFDTVMNNIRLIDNSAAGAEGYTRPDMPLLVDLLVSKILNDEKRNEIIEYVEGLEKTGQITESERDGRKFYKIYYDNEN